MQVVNFRIFKPSITSIIRGKWTYFLTNFANKWMEFLRKGILSQLKNRLLCQKQKFREWLYKVLVHAHVYLVWSYCLQTNYPWVINPIRAGPYDQRIRLGRLGWSTGTTQGWKNQKWKACRFDPKGVKKGPLPPKKRVKQ